MRDFKIRTVVILLVLIGCLGLIVTNFRPISDAVSERNAAVEYAATVEKMTLVQDAMNAVQRERGLSVVQIVSGAASPSAALLAQRTETDAMVAEVFETFAQNVTLRVPLRDLQAATAQIDALRSGINSGSVADVDAIDLYSGVVERMISVVAQATTLNAGNVDTQSASALVVLMRARDLAGLERAYGSALLATAFSQPKHQSGFRQVSYGRQMALGLVDDLSLGALSSPIAELNASGLQVEMDRRRAQFVSRDLRMIGQITVANWLDLTTQYIGELSAIEVAVLNSLSSDARAAGVEAARFLVISSVVSSLILAGMIGTSLALYAAVRKRLSGALAAMDALSKGKLDAPIPAVSDSELGKICAGLATFKDVLVAQENLKQQALGQEQAQREVVETMQAALAKLASGDLKTTLRTPFPDQYEPLRLNYNEAIQRLSMALGNLLTTTDDIHEGAAEMSQSARDLAARTETQAATLEQTAAALDELTASVKSAADGAGRANDVVSQAHGEAQRSGEIVTAAVESMDAISASSKEISQIIGVIQDIAFQTNLLALNAGVEAARAGDAGRGFAVVASEVRALAQRSSDAVKEIRDLIGQSSKHVTRGVDMVGEAGAALTLIFGRVSEISSLVSDLAASSKEQALGLSEINSGVNQLDQVTQQNAAMVEESTAAALTLSTHAELMKKSMDEFTILQRAGTLPDKTKTARPQTIQRPPLHTPSRPQRQHAGAATAWASQDDLDQEALDIEDNWDAF
jgi:methyl-accepting chemotaxis protein